MIIQNFRHLSNKIDLACNGVGLEDNTYMSIKLRFDKGSLSTQVVLKDEALPELLKIISEHQSDERSPAVQKAYDTPLPPPSVFGDPLPAGNEDERINFARNWVAQHSPSEILSKIGWDTYPEKIVLMGAKCEIADGEGWRSADIELQFSSARVAAPGNFARDISVAIRAGFVATVTPRTYRVARTGWLRIYAAIVESTVIEASQSKS